MRTLILTINREDIQWPKEWEQNPETATPVGQLDSFIQSVSNAQIIFTIDQTITLDGTTDVEFIPKGSIYLDGYIVGTTSAAVTVGDSNDRDGLLTSTTLSGLTRFNGEYLLTKSTVEQDNIVTVTATTTEAVRVVVSYYLPRI